jgi:uncharacterized membrane protein
MSGTASADPKSPLADHVTETVDVIAAFHKAHQDGASPLQKAMDAVTDRLGRPVFVACVIVGIAAWIGATLASGARNISEPSFTWLELAATIFALMVAMMILVTQRRQDRLLERRAQLTLELAIVADRKTAKLIALIEELRRDHPDLEDRDDAESREMAKPTDPESVLAAIEERAGGDDSSRAALLVKPKA